MSWTRNVFRTFGGTKEPWVADPLVKGYGFCYIVLPSEVGDASDSAKLAALSRSFTGIGNITLETEAIEGLGGIKFNVPTKLTMPDRFTIEYMEVQDAFVFNLHKKWINLIRDMRYGASNLEGDNYTKTKYSGICYVWITLPDAKTVVDAYVLTGVVPVSLPIESLGWNLTDVAKVDVSIEYVFDHIYFYKKAEGGTNDPIKSAFESKLGSLIEEVKNEWRKFAGE